MTSQSFKKKMMKFFEKISIKLDCPNYYKHQIRNKQSSSKSSVFSFETHKKIQFVVVGWLFLNLASARKKKNKFSPVYSARALFRLVPRRYVNDRKKRIGTRREHFLSSPRFFFRRNVTPDNDHGFWKQIFFSYLRLHLSRADTIKMYKYRCW